jgi:hypothetical protein
VDNQTRALPESPQPGGERESERKGEREGGGGRERDCKEY